MQSPLGELMTINMSADQLPALPVKSKAMSSPSTSPVPVKVKGVPAAPPESDSVMLKSVKQSQMPPTGG